MIKGVVLYSPDGSYREYEVGKLLDKNLVVYNIHDNMSSVIPILTIDVMDNEETLHLEYIKTAGLPFISVRG